MHINNQYSILAAFILTHSSLTIAGPLIFELFQSVGLISILYSNNFNNYINLHCWVHQKSTFYSCSSSNLGSSLALCPGSHKWLGFYLSNSASVLLFEMRVNPIPKRKSVLMACVLAFAWSALVFFSFDASTRTCLLLQLLTTWLYVRFPDAHCTP